VSFETQTKLAIYRHFAETGQGPSLEAVAQRVRADVSSVREAYVQLRAQRVLVLEPDGVSIRMAPPFSGIPTQHVVTIDKTKYFANCAWDSFGIAAALHRPGRVHSRCEQSGELLCLEIGLEGPPPCSWLFHCLVPAAKWWDDIVFT
jgi:Alkylmercury lyase